MHRSLTDDDYQRATNKHGRRLNSRRNTPMHVMAAYALRGLDSCEGNLNQMAAVILVRSAHPCITAPGRLQGALSKPGHFAFEQELTW